MFPERREDSGPAGRGGRSSAARPPGGCRAAGLQAVVASNRPGETAGAEPFSRGCFENVLKGQHTVVYINYRWPNKREDSPGNITWLGVKRRLSYIMGVECQI
ncbi:hypothetical protein VULLAG_LOCUS15949 [Vulpes lagopus]